MNPGRPMTDGFKRDVLRGLASAFAVGLAASLLFAFLIMLAAPAAASTTGGASADRRPAEEGSQLILRTADGHRLADAPLLQTDVDIQVSGLIARGRVEQHFHNPGDQWVEGVYVFPLPDMAAVDHLEMQVGERIIVGEIQEKQQAQRTYDKAKSEGKRASLLRQERPNMFTSAVANIPPGGDVIIRIEYQQDLKPVEELFQLRMPLVVAPRYIPGTPIKGETLEDFGSDGFNQSGWSPDTDEVLDASQITPPVVDEDEPHVNPVTIRVDLTPGFPLGTLRSLHHPIRQEEKSPGHYSVELAEGPVPADRDFVLEWQAAPGGTPRAALFTEQWNGEQYGLLMLTPPHEMVQGAPLPARELILVVDTSGSMHGDSMSQARDAVRLAVQRLTPRDRFNIIRFSDDLDSLFREPVPASADNLSRAVRYVNALQADGGTEMLPAVRRALRQRAEPGMLRQVVFLTDGAVGNEKALFDAIHADLGDSRLFTVGIGSAPNSYFMTRAAGFGRGSFTHISRIEDVEERMRALFRRLESPALTDIQLQTADGGKLEVLPGNIPDLYFGEPLMLSLKSAAPMSAVTVRGRFGDRDWEQTLNLQGGADRPGLHVLWGRRQIADLMAEQTLGGDAGQIRLAIIDVAMRHHLVSKHTSLVAVDKTPVRPADEALLQKGVPTNLPKGWSQAKVFGRLPQTDTPAALHMLLGLAALLGALGLRRRREA